MKKYQVTGMSCAACSARVEKAVNAVEGVTSCSVSLLTNSMMVDGSASADSIIKAVTDAGYGASALSDKTGDGSKTNNNMANEDVLEDKETPKMKRRLIASLGFLIALMYISMGAMMWGWPLPEFLEKNHLAMGLTQLLLTIIVMVINQKFFINGFKGLINRAPNMDTLVALGSGAAFVYSTYALYEMADGAFYGNHDKVMKYMHEFYFESAAMILTLITVGKMLESRSKGKTTNAIRSLMELSPKMANVIRNGKEVQIAASEVLKDEVFVVYPGENIPVDGIVIEGHSAIDEAALTGESIPVDKEIGNSVYAATINQSGFIKCKATKVGEDTTLAKIIEMVSDAAATKAPIAKIADKVSGVFVPVVITIAVVTTLVWLLIGQSVGFSLARGISVLVISCPCALGLATPVAIMVGNGLSAKNGILFKTATSIEETGKATIVALDKTGTITKGEPRVTDIVPNESVSDKELIAYAKILERQSEHPLAKAIIAYETENELETKNWQINDFEALPGNGLTVKIDNVQEKFNLFGGNYKFISQKVQINENNLELAKKLADEGKTPLFFAKDNTFLGIIAVADVIKEDSKQAIEELKNMGIHVVMLTGDNEKTAKAIGENAGVSEVMAGLMPQDKETVIKELKSKGKVIMVGDGINDAPALTRADIGIAIGAGTDIAIDAADIVLMKSKLPDVAAAIRVSRATLKNIKENLFWAFIYNTIGIPLAAGAFIHLFGWELNPMFGAAAMSMSSFCVVTNALRLNLFKPYDSSHDKKIKQNNKKKEVKEMTKTIKIEGMMCPHCEATVKKALENLEQVSEAVVSHKDGTAIVTLSADIENDILKTTVEEKDFKVTDIEG
ncbi:MAG: heavy metal translocating P-type ATPase [Lachnospiraceae bacterium]|nr:heavy metal translocating P-type ATPase [Lachnospiraceae bacterium]